MFRKIVRSSAWTLAGSEVTAVLGLVTSIVIIRLMSPDEVGRYALAAAIVSFVTSGATLQAGGYYVVTKEPSVALLRTGLTLELLIGMGLFSALTLGSLIYGAAADSFSFAGLLVLSGLVLLTNPFGSLRCTFERELAYRKQTITLIGATILGTVTKIVLVALGLGPWGLAAGDVAVGVVYGGSMLAMVPAGRGFALDRELARRQLGFGLPSLGTSVLSSAIVRVPEWTVAAVLGTRQLGFFYLAWRIPFQIYNLGRSLSVTLLPAFSRVRGAQLERGFFTTCRLSAFLMAIPLAIVLALSAPIVVALYGPVWKPAAIPFALLMSALAVRFVFWHVGNLLKSRERVKDLLLLNGLQLALIVVATPLGVAIGGLVGAAAAVLAVEVVLVPVKIQLIRSVTPFDTVRALAAPLASLAAGIAVAGLAGIALDTYPAVVVGSGLAVIAGVWVAWRADAATMLRIVSSFRRAPHDS